MLSLNFGSKWVTAAAPKSVVRRQRHLRNLCCFSNWIQSNGTSSEIQTDFSSPSSSSKDFSSLEGFCSPLAPLFECNGLYRAVWALISSLYFVFLNTEVQHGFWHFVLQKILHYSLWKHVIRKGDVVVDATCGNGYDTLAMVKMVADESGSGRVYAMDVQKEALESTSALMDESLSEQEACCI